MNKKNFIAILLQKHLEAEGHLSDKAFALSDARFTRKNFQEGYKYALIEVQNLVETFNGEEIKDEKSRANEVDYDFIEQIKYKA